MSIAPQWLAVALVGFAGTPDTKTDGSEIIYQFQEQYEPNQGAARDNRSSLHSISAFH